MGSPYLTKAYKVHACRVLGSETGEATRLVAEWCGGDPGGSYDDPHILVPHGNDFTRANAGDWIVKDSLGVVDVYDDSTFRYRFERTW
jgi:hypothetical protein